MVRFTSFKTGIGKSRANFSQKLFGVVAISGRGERRPSRRCATRWSRVSKKVTYQWNSFAIGELVEVEKPKTQNRFRACWYVTNTDTQTITRLRRLILNLPLRLSARHTTRARRDPRRAPQPRHALRPHDARAERDARSRARRFSNLGSASSRRRRWCVWVLQELPEMPQPPENEAGLTAPRPEVFLRGLNLGI